ncbi:flagellar protein FliS [Luteibacter rhizovicinus]|uniref:Flagellar secretion chaperone FliS n=1 Tax=Luteibacter rhizovicinus TaxID=242606 RepID=A0A4R3YND4_9GAMM|nr:flagellar export chaperone FliS [Luteibacter rhizovicinus]TCV94147.1 flagellar protein FliS [Luteibacter rhizovicinus]
MALGYANGAGAYQQVRTHGGVEAADAHGLITMLMDGGLERIRFATGCIATGNIAGKGEAISRAIEIVGTLQASLNHDVKTALVGQLDSLYDYMSRRLLLANVKNDVAILDEVAGLLRQLRESWVAIPADARQLAEATS